MTASNILRSTTTGGLLHGSHWNKDRDVWILDYGGIELNEKKRTRKNAKPKVRCESKGRERNVERERKPKQKSRAPKVEQNGNSEARLVES